MTHTELPWRRTENDVFIEGNGEDIAIILKKFDNWQDNAEFIVRACNNFEALVEALELINRECLHGEGDGCVAGEVARIALAAARGEKAPS